MQKWLILPLGALLGSCLTAAAQTSATKVALFREPSVHSQMSIQAARPQSPPVPALPAQPAKKKLIALTALFARADSPDLGLKRLFSFEEFKTTFVTESRVPLIRLPGGRLQLEGYTSTYHMENLLLGPSSAGHPGERIPRSTWVYGVSLRFRLGRDAQTERRTDGSR